MRFAERVCCGLVAAIVGSGGTGCASVMELKEKVMPAASAPAAAPAPAAASASAPVVARPVVAVVNETPLSPTVQRTFDDAVRAQRAGKPADAERGYRALMQSNPELGGPHANLGVMYRQAGKLPEAVTELEQAVKINPKQPVYLNQLGITYRQLGQFEKARGAYEKAIDANADYAPASLNLGILNDLYLGDAKRAAELYERYLALSPGGDPVVTKWVAELKNRKVAQAAASRKEKS
jgi:Flp pilus assembly protein TadD